MHVFDTRAPAFRYAVRPRRSDVVIDVEGELDCATVPRLVEALEDLRAVGWDAIAVDLTGVTFVDSTGLRAFLRMEACARDEVWQFTLHGPCPPLDRLLAVTGLQDQFVRT